MSRFRSSFAVAAATAALASTPATTAQLLYDVDFSSPTHTVGQPPTTGGGPAPRDTVSTIVFGNPTVVAAVGALDDQPCQFSSVDETIDQIRLDVDDFPADANYRITSNVIVTAAASNFTVLIDTPQVRRIDFTAGGAVTIFVPGVSNQSIGNYVIGQVVALQVDIDLTADTWEIRLDGKPAHTGGFGNAAGVTSVRYSTPTGNPPPPVNAGVDDITITAGPIADCPEDLDGSGAVDFGDILAILGAWGNAGGSEDLDGSGTVDFGDLLVVLGAWGPCP